LLVAYAGDPEVRAIAKTARSRVAYYALDGDDTGDVVPTWLAAPAPAEGGVQPFDLFYGGSASGRVYSPLSGMHNVKNTLAAIALCAEGAGLPVQQLVRRVASFSGVRRRQELVATADGVRVYDDFAHHPTAVLETLRGLRARHPSGRLIALFEPRSATASRKLHQAAYASAFEAADLAIIAPVGRKEIAEGERLDVAEIARAIEGAGKTARSPADHAAIVALLLEQAQPGDTIVAMSNGDFGGIVNRIVVELTMRATARG
jgi:UDP-N-acetylmuramate: L-alanyl-gamma-D-glutamyl-meso-diaminopimelate ligase